CQQVYKIPFTF
nr:immunoglobulin light chain junction region [Macaca mulatta]MOX23769.1 immunoglobulin light chain junction region [Macaca mulatta]MOX23802.1 immunoglobulin light chain junction region [Macaca mulatta]MOX23882.1 immunoglobulin light chain junction region [Macaca mulatta]MOX24561.1 immunoglobulin light chain junction region [Macaca mulatta]